MIGRKGEREKKTKDKSKKIKVFPIFAVHLTCKTA